MLVRCFAPFKILGLPFYFWGIDDWIGKSKFFQTCTAELQPAVESSSDHPDICTPNLVALRKVSPNTFLPYPLI